MNSTIPQTGSTQTGASNGDALDKVSLAHARRSFRSTDFFSSSQGINMLEKKVQTGRASHSAGVT